MTADAPQPDPSLPPPMDAVGGADALAEGSMLTSAGAVSYTHLTLPTILRV